jgi:GcrA cell cycle regulator
MTWSDPHVEILKAEWDAGKSASQIARIIGPPHTRCSVLGKARRLGLASRAGQHTATPRAPRPEAERRQPRQRLALVPAPIPLEEPTPLTLESGDKITVLNISDRMCKWPFGDPRYPDEFHFCGAQPMTGSRYCSYHHKKSVIPLPDFWRRFRPPGYG